MGSFLLGLNSMPSSTQVDILAPDSSVPGKVYQRQQTENIAAIWISSIFSFVLVALQEGVVSVRGATI